MTLLQQIHGGSILVFVQERGGPAVRSKQVDALVQQERDEGLMTLAPYRRFAQRVEESRERLLTVITRLRQQATRLIGYGAAAKGNTLLNYCGIGREHLEYVADRSPLK